MIISRTPFRISFFGGGTDYPEWFASTAAPCSRPPSTSTVTSACASCRRSSITNSASCTRSSKTSRRSARSSTLRFAACSSWLKVARGLEIHHDGDLPARSGLGSSSAFTVGLINAVHALAGRIRLEGSAGERGDSRGAVCCCRSASGCRTRCPRRSAASTASRVSAGRHVHGQPDGAAAERLEALQDHLMLVFTGISRNAPEVAQTVVGQPEAEGCRPAHAAADGRSGDRASCSRRQRIWSNSGGCSRRRGR